MAGKLHTNVEFVRSIVQNLKGIILDAGLLHSEPLFKRCDITEVSPN